MDEQIPEKEEDQSMKDFSSTIATCQSKIKSIDAQIDNLMRLKAEVISSTGQEERQISNKINMIVNSVQTTQNEMDKLIKELKAMLNTEGGDINDPELRIKNNLFGSMLRKYQNTCMRFQREESNIKNIIETKLVRAAEIAVNQELTEEQRKEVIENPQMVQQMYENKLTGAAHIKLQNAVRDLEERHRDIKKLEKSILQVHNMIIELSKLVSLQGEMIDNIEVNIQKAKDYVIKGEKNVDKSKKNLQSARKKKCIIILIIVGVLIVILIPTIIALVK
jgi:t-SNARE complex subunit (syntaxin)